MFRKSFLPPVADLLAFESASRHASISLAAEELHLTQSAVSRQNRQLEGQLGMALFHRVRQRVVLTDAGRVYAADVRAVLQQLSERHKKPWHGQTVAGCSTWRCCPPCAHAG
ncbi:MAG: LysR family transcriptional regulator [Rhodoferax sp.]|uniref:LysR family transcriptional regulator n=1 Tax=Rhodoferax sp. TaxID=50421 RepID=UPI00261C5DB4|nr:LysR family transcriptional regulator [Rhodoferax sp.]MDD2878907.1 LysR family transcriptional regulator [Rhodoferax sp.]